MQICSNILSLADRIICMHYEDITTAVKLFSLRKISMLLRTSLVMVIGKSIL